MAQPIHPPYGARFQIERSTSTAEEATYTIQIFTADAVYRYDAVIEAGAREGEWTSDASTDSLDPLPEWAEKHATSLLRQCAQQAKRKGIWPRRIRRWHEPNEKS